MAHNLAIEIPPITNPKVMRIYDISSWDSNILSTQIKLEIISPGFIYPVTQIVSRRFDKLFNVSNLGIYPVTDYAELTALPDGIYVIRLTNTNGSQEDWVEYNHLRQTSLLNCWYTALCGLRLEPCDNLTKDKEEKRKELYRIKSYIDAAKAEVEYCNSPNSGLELHNYAKKLLEKYNNKCKC